MSYAAAAKQGLSQPSSNDDVPPGFSTQKKKQDSKQTKNVKQVKPTTSTAPAPPGLIRAEDIVQFEHDNLMWSEDSSDDDEFKLEDSPDSDDDLKVYGSGEKRYVKKGTDIEAVKKKENEKKEKNSAKKAQNTKPEKKSLLEIEFQNIKNLILSEYSGSLSRLNAICQDINDGLESEVKSRERLLSDQLKDLNAPKSDPKKVWEGGARKQQSGEGTQTTIPKNTRDGGNTGKGKGNFQQGSKGGNFQQGGKAGKGNFQGKGQGPKVEPKKTSKVTFTTRDDDGFILKHHVTSEQAKKIASGEVKLEPVVYQDDEVVVEKKKTKPKVPKNSVVANNPFSAVLIASSFSTPEEDLAQQKAKKAQAVAQNKSKQKVEGAKHIQQIKSMQQQQQAAKAKNKKKNTTKVILPVKKPVAKVAPKKAEPKKKVSNATKQQQEKFDEQKNKRKLEKERQRQAEEKRLLNEKKKIEAGVRDTEKEKKLRRLATQKKDKDQPWYEHEYAQPAALVGACAVLLTLVYSFVLQVE